jgi:Ribonuclease G/E
MTVELQAVSSPGEIRIAAFHNAELLEYAVWRPGAPDGVGDLHVGRIASVVPAMAGAFVALNDADGFLPDSEGAKGLTVGSAVAVRVTRSPQGQKGPRLTARLTGEEQAAAASATAGLIRRGTDPLQRLAQRFAEASVVVDDASLAAALRPSLAARVRLSPNATFPDEIATAIDSLSDVVVTLPDGCRLSIWPTPALVAIDVDAGAAVGGRGGHQAINRTALPAVAAQIRLRNLSGAIVVDVAGLSARKRAALGPDFVQALGPDPLRPRFLGFTALGLAEIVRSRVHPPLHEVTDGPLAAGLSALRALLAARGSHPGATPALRAAPSVVSALQADPVALPDLVRRTGRAPIVRSDPSLSGFTWMLEHDHG